MQYGARQLGCTKVQVHSYPDEPSHGARCSSAPVVTRSSAARTDAAIAASACDDTLTTTLGYVQRRVALRDITNHV